MRLAYTPTPRRQRFTRLKLPVLAGALILCSAVGCTHAERTLTPLERRIAAAARPILEMDPDADWTERYNTLLDLTPASVAYLAEHPRMKRRCAPDDLRVMLHTGLLRLLVDPASAPRLSVNCFERNLDLLHFDMKVRRRPLGKAYVAPGSLPLRWHDLYPGDFNTRAAAAIDADADRRAMRRWWLDRRGSTLILPRRKLHPRPKWLWHLLARRRADVWAYMPEPTALLCAATEPQLSQHAPRYHSRTLLDERSADYNLVRAACVVLGRSRDPLVRGRLIELVGHPADIVSYNARLALTYSPDPRIRELLDRFERSGSGAPTEPPPAPADKRPITRM